MIYIYVDKKYCVARTGVPACPPDGRERAGNPNRIILSSMIYIYVDKKYCVARTGVEPVLLP